jgi:hypothetical protein
MIISLLHITYHDYMLILIRIHKQFAMKLLDAMDILLTADLDFKAPKSFETEMVWVRENENLGH